MKIGYMSDFHLEGLAAKTRSSDETLLFVLEDALPPKGSFDLLIAAGDMGYSEWIISLLDRIGKLLECKILYTPGNHEFYDCQDGLTFQIAMEAMQSEADESENVTMLVNDSIEFHDEQVSIWMSPFYTDFSLSGGSINSMREVQQRIADYRWTSFSGEDGQVRTLLARDHLKLCQDAQASLESWLETTKELGYTPIVVTHWGCSSESRHQGFPDSDALASYFNTDYLDRKHSLFPPRSVWIHGHTHFNVDYQLGNVRVTSNQLGYIGSKAFWEQKCTQEFNPLKYIEV